MNSEQLFHQRVSEKRVQLSENTQQQRTFTARAVLYLNTAVTWGRELKIDGAPTEYLKLSQVDDADLVEPLMDLEMLLDKIRARNIEAFEPKYRDASVGLNDEWRAHVTTLVGHIREAVTNATVDEPLREAILDAVEKLQREVNRNRTRLDAAAEVWDKLTDAIGKGAKNLEPAVKIIERIRKRLGGVQRAEIEAVEHPKLPPPPVDEDEKPEN